MEKEEQQANQKPKKNQKNNKNNNKNQGINIQMIKKIIELTKNAIKIHQEQMMAKEIKTLSQNYIKCIGYQQVGQLQKCLDQTLKQHQKQNQNIVKEYLLLSSIFRQTQISTPVNDTFFNSYLNQIKTINLQKSELLNLCRVISYKNLQKFIKELELVQEFSNQSPQMYEFFYVRVIKFMISLLADDKIQHCCEYYKLYQPPQLSPEESSWLQQFQTDHLIPKLIKSDKIFTNYVLDLIKVNQPIKKAIIKQIDPQNGLRVIQNLGQDARKYPNVHRYILRQHYKSIFHEHGQTWYIMEDKISFSTQFIQWYCEDLPNHVIFNGKPVSRQNLKKSILYRAGLVKKQQVNQMIQNPLYLYDHYGCVETILQKIIYGDHQNQNKKTYLNLNNQGLHQKQIMFIDSIDSVQFQRLKNKLKTDEIILVGYDSQFRCVQSKFDQQGVAIIQLCFQDEGYILDFIKLQYQKEFRDFIVQFFTNPKVIKIGHTISSDIGELSKTFNLPKDKQFKGFVDIVKMFKEKYPGLLKSSLSYLFQGFNDGKKLSKYEQRSNWIRRPLKKTQIHYSISDSYACLNIYEKIQQNTQFHDWDEEKISPNLEKHQIIRENNLVYSTKFVWILKTKYPIFLVDNMLKKLCSTMRNVGIDTEYLSTKDYKLGLEIAERDGRIILTKDNKYFQRKEQSAPLYLLQEDSDSDAMFNEIVKKFKLNLKKYTSLSRCNKCNGPQLQVISTEEALKSLNFQYEQKNIRQYWRCIKCKQIYWQGNQFKRAQQQYSDMKKEKIKNKKR